MTLDTVLRRDPDIVYAPLGDDGVMLNIDAGSYHSLNQVGVRIWDLLETPRTARALRDQLLAEFEVGESDCEAATLDFLGKLLERGLIHAEA